MVYLNNGASGSMKGRWCNASKLATWTTGCYWELKCGAACSINIDEDIAWGEWGWGWIEMLQRANMKHFPLVKISLEEHFDMLLCGWTFMASLYRYWSTGIPAHYRQNISERVARRASQCNTQPKQLKKMHWITQHNVKKTSAWSVRWREVSVANTNSMQRTHQWYQKRVDVYFWLNRILCCPLTLWYQWHIYFKCSKRSSL